MASLVIVESPTKAKTISRFLSQDNYIIRASLGHVRDLPDNASQLPEKLRKKDWAHLGVDVDNGFVPIYVVKDGRSKKAITDLKKELKGAERALTGNR